MTIVFIHCHRASFSFRVYLVTQSSNISHLLLPRFGNEPIRLRWQRRLSEGIAPTRTFPNPHELWREGKTGHLQHQFSLLAMSSKLKGTVSCGQKIRCAIPRQSRGLCKYRLVKQMLGRLTRLKLSQCSGWLERVLWRLFEVYSLQ